MQALLTAIVVWLSANFALPPVYDHPRIERISSIEMTSLLYQGALGAQRREKSTIENQDQPDQRRQIVSLYNVTTKTIYLTPEWTGRTSAELSILVHEMVHHLQNVAHTAYACPLEREKLAYEAQEKWLSLFGRSLLSEFGLDQTTLVLTSACFE